MSSPQANLTPDGRRDPSQRRAVPRLSLRGIEKSFDSNVVLSGIDLDVYEGELVALLGENGGRQVHHVVNHRGAFPAFHWHDDLGGPTLRTRAAGRGYRDRHRTHPSGDATLTGPVNCRKRLYRPSSS